MTMETIAAIVLGVPAAVYSVKAVVTVLLQDKLIYASRFPPGSRGSGAVVSDARQVFIQQASGGRPRLQLWHWPSLASTATTAATATATSRRTLLYFQGNAGSLGMRQSHILKLRRLDPHMEVIAMHYRGYGHSQGWATERGIKRDVDALMAHLSSTRPDTASYVVFGHSLGAAVGLDLAVRYPRRVSRVICENPFLSIEAMVQEIYPRWSMYHHLTPFLWNRWDNVEAVRCLKCPVLIVCGGGDEVVPCEHGRRLFKEASPLIENRYVELPGGLHDTTWKHAGYEKAIKSFLDDQVVK